MKSETMNITEIKKKKKTVFSGPYIHNCTIHLCKAGRDQIKCQALFNFAEFKTTYNALILENTMTGGHRGLKKHHSSIFGHRHLKVSVKAC